MILGLHHVSITTPDVDRLASFYRDLFGFTLMFEGRWDGGNATADEIYALPDTAVRIVMLRTANVSLELFQFDRPIGKPAEPDRPVCDAGYTHMCLAVEDIEAEYARLREAGMRFHCAPRTAPGLCKATYGRDPDGNIVELMEVVPGGPFDLAVPR